MIKRLLLMAAAVSAALLVLAGPASAQYQPAGTQVLSDTVVDPGQVISVSGSGCDAGAEVQIAFDGVIVVVTNADGGGQYSSGLRIPGNATPGFHDIVSTCASNGQTLVLTSTVEVVASGAGSTGTTGTGGTTGTVTGAGGTAGGGSATGTTTTTTTGGGTLPRTGSASMAPLINVGILMLVGGGLLLIGVRKRNRAFSRTA